MAIIQLRANKAKPSTSGGFSVVFDLTREPDPFPPRDIEIKTTAEALAALETYKAEAKAIGAPMAVCMRLKNGQRSPNGFKAATANQFYHRINV